MIAPNGPAYLMAGALTVVTLMLGGVLANLSRSPAVSSGPTPPTATPQPTATPDPWPPTLVAQGDERNALLRMLLPVPTYPPAPDVTTATPQPVPCERGLPGPCQWSTATPAPTPTPPPLPNCLTPEPGRFCERREPTGGAARTNAGRAAAGMGDGGSTSPSPVAPLPTTSSGSSGGR